MAQERTSPMPIQPHKVVNSPLAPDAATFSRFLDHCHRRRYPSRNDVFRPGTPATSLYYVVSGSLSVVSEEPDGRELILGYVNAGEFIGEMGLFFAADARAVVVRTRSACELAEINYDRLDTSRKASRLAFLDVSGRIVRTLHDLCQEPDALSHPQGTQIRVSRQELARIVGCSREMAGRVLKQLQEQGILHARGKTVVVYGTR